MGEELALQKAKILFKLKQPLKKSTGKKWVSFSTSFLLAPRQ